jgi:two-component system, response regulator PdtaR
MAKTVLIVEDEFLVALDLETVLQRAGYGVLGPAHSVQNAMELIEAKPCDAALLDANLAGGESVLPIAAALRARAIPFVVVTGYAANQLPTELATAPVVAKPIREQRLIRVLAACLDGSGH